MVEKKWSDEFFAISDNLKKTILIHQFFVTLLFLTPWGGGGQGGHGVKKASALNLRCSMSQSTQRLGSCMSLAMLILIIIINNGFIMRQMILQYIQSSSGVYPSSKCPSYYALIFININKFQSIQKLSWNLSDYSVNYWAFKQEQMRKYIFEPFTKIIWRHFAF